MVKVLGFTVVPQNTIICIANNNNNNNNNRHFYSAIYLDNSILRHIYYYPGFSLAAVYTALQHFKEIIPARYPFTSPGSSVANVD